MIEIDNTAEMRQLESGDFKFAGYFGEKFAEQFLAMKRQAKERNCKMGLTLMLDHPEVQPVEDILMSEVEDDLERTLSKIKARKKMGEVGSIGGDIEPSAVPEQGANNRFPEDGPGNPLSKEEGE